MSKFKNSILRELGIKESSLKPEIKENAFPGIDPEDHDGNMQPDPVDPRSPRAVATPVIAMAVRGSSTGGLPSGQNLVKLGGYEPVNSAKENSLIVNKTPESKTISSPAPIASNEDSGMPTTPGAEHPHQMQNSEDQPPQAVTGASTEGEESLQLKAALPQGIDVDVSECDCEHGSDEDNNSNNPEFQEKDRDQWRKDRAASPEGEDVRQHLGMKESKIPTHKLYEVRRSLQEKAVAGKMSKKESEVFKCITEVLQKRGKGLEQRLFGKKTMVQTAGVISEGQLPHEEVLQTWNDDKSSNEFISVNDKGDAYYHQSLIAPSNNGSVDWSAIKAWATQNSFWPNVWVGNDHGNVELHTIDGQSLGGLV